MSPSIQKASKTSIAGSFSMPTCEVDSAETLTMSWDDLPIPVTLEATKEIELEHLTASNKETGV